MGLPNGLQCACKSTLCSQHNTAGRKFQSGGARPRVAEGKAFNGSGETAPPLDETTIRKKINKNASF